MELVSILNLLNTLFTALFASKYDVTEKLSIPFSLSFFFIYFTSSILTSLHLMKLTLSILLSSESRNIVSIGIKTLP